MRDIWNTLGTRFSVLFLGTLSSILLTRALGPEGRGLYMGVMSISALAIQLGTLGLGSSNTYYLSGRRESADALAANTTTISVVFGVVLAIVGWFAAGHVHGLREDAGAQAVLLALVCIPVSLLMFFGQNLQLAVHDIAGFNRIELARSASALCLIVALVVGLRGEYTTALWINLVTTSAATVWLWRRVANEAGLRIRLGWDRALFQRTLGYGLKAYAITFLGYLVLKIDALLVQNWRGAVEAGQYSVAVQVGDLLMTVSATIAMIVFPKAAALGTDVWPLIKRTTAATATALGLACVLAYGLAPFAVTTVFGDSFLPAAYALRALLPGLWFLSIEILLVQYLNGLGMPIQLVWAWLAALCLNLYLNWLWIPMWGITGAAWASTAAYVAVTAFVLVLVALQRRGMDRIRDDSAVATGDRVTELPDAAPL